VRRRIAIAVLALLAAGIVLGFVYAGSATKLASGVRIAGIDVGGLEAGDARALLQRRSDAAASRAIVFTAGSRRFRISARELGVEPDWHEAVAAAQRQGDGFGPLRGFKRLDVEMFGADVAPPVSVLRGALDFELSRIANAVVRRPRDAALVRRGSKIVVVPARTGYILDRSASAETIVHTLAALDRPGDIVALPLRTTQPKVHAAALRRAAADARVALSAPVVLQFGSQGRRVLSPSTLARLLQLPHDGGTALAIAGPAADAWMKSLGRKVEHPAKDATFAVDGGHVRLVPDRPGERLDAEATAVALLRTALRPRLRVARAVVVDEPAALTAAKARTMGIHGVVSSFTTIYGGVPNRIHNVEVVAHLVDDKLIAPNETFSFNKTTGERTAAKGFLVAPVIINGEVTTGLGGGVCQVSTTVFNAAFDAGLKITERTNHALYISHYPQGRDATVNYPDVDLKFVNDTGHWLLLRTFVGSSSLTVTLFGTPTHRKVESTTSPLVVHGVPPVKKTVDKTLKPGEKIVDDPGEPAMSTSVTRDVYTAKGALLYHDIWYSSYRAAPKLVRIGPKLKKATQKKQQPPPTK
jgi:vancomycin resistance protein YoaR